MSFFDKLKNGLSKTKTSFDEKINNVFSGFRKVDEELLEELEEALIMSDVGTETTLKIIENLRNKIKKENIQEEQEVKRALKEVIKEIFNKTDNELKLETTPSVILVVGVNRSRQNNIYWKNSKQFKKKWKKSSSCSSRYI